MKVEKVAISRRYEPFDLHISVETERDKKALSHILYEYLASTKDLDQNIIDHEYFIEEAQMILITLRDQK